jgi:hypothetical protein
MNAVCRGPPVVCPLRRGMARVPFAVRRRMPSSLSLPPRLYGTITSGFVDWPGSETVAELTAALTVTGGTLYYRNVTGSGAFAGYLDHVNRVGGIAPTWYGVLTLDLSK